MKPATDRYVVDERGGCIAVVDTSVKNLGPGLGRDYRGVVAYWSGNPCRKLWHWRSPPHWHVPKTLVRKAERVAREFNLADAGEES